MSDTIHSKLTFEDFDQLERKSFSERLEAFLKVERTFVDGSLVVSLNSEFGTGKTAFLKMWESSLLKRRESDESLPVPIFLNAWEDDYCGDPMIAIVSGLTGALETQKTTVPESKTKALFKEAEHAVRTLYLLGNQFVSNRTGFDLEAAKEQAKVDTQGGKMEPAPLFIQTFRQRQHALKTLKKALNECFPGADGVKGLVFVDELDRCRPNYAVEYLETIKHVFDVRGLVFVLAIDKRQLQSSVSALFGSSIDFEGYFRKFVQRQIGFPKSERHIAARLVSGYINRFVVSDERQSLLGERIDSRLGDAICEICECFDLSLREIQEALRIYGHAMATTNSGQGGSYAFVRTTFFMCACSLKEADLFRALGLGDISPIEFDKHLLSQFQRLEASRQDDWRRMLMIGYLSKKSENQEAMLTEMIRIGIYSDREPGEREKAEKNFSGWCQTWGSHVYFRAFNWFGEIADCIVAAKRFG